jgi:hypothetical protein
MTTRGASLEAELVEKVNGLGIGPRPRRDGHLLAPG